jgi:hypothetical protein
MRRRCRKAETMWFFADDAAGIRVVDAPAFQIHFPNPGGSEPTSSKWSTTKNSLTDPHSVQTTITSFDPGRRLRRHRKFRPSLTPEEEAALSALGHY